jgi:hypothetical protein
MRKLHNGNILFFSRNANIREIHNQESAPAYIKLFAFIKENNLKLLKRTEFEAEIEVNLLDIMAAGSSGSDKDCEDCEGLLHLKIHDFLVEDLNIDLPSLGLDCEMITIAFIDHENINMDMMNSIDKSELARYKLERNNLNNIILMAQENGDILSDTVEEYHKILVEQGKNEDPEVSSDVVES